MTPKFRLVPLRRHRHGHGRTTGGAIFALLAGMRPGPSIGAPAPFAPATPGPDLGAGPSRPPAGAAAAPEAWSRFQSGLAAGG